MDPDACWRLMLQALNDDDVVAAAAAAIDLETWLRGGGFYPAQIDRMGLTPRGTRRLLACISAAPFGSEEEEA